MVGHSRPRPKDKSISIGCAKCQIFDIWCTKHQKTSHMRCFKIFGIDEQYCSKFRMKRIKMLKKIIIHFLFPLYDFFLLSLSFFFFLLRLTLLSSFCSLSLSLSLPQIFSLSLPWRSVIVIVIMGRGDNSYLRVGFMLCQLMSIRLYELTLIRHVY